MQDLPIIPDPPVEDNSKVETASYSIGGGEGVDSQISDVIIVGPDGRIISIGFYSGAQPPAGPQPDGNYVVYFYTAQNIDTSDYIELYYYDFDTNTFVKGPAKPHVLVSWDNNTNTWVPITDEYDNSVASIVQSLLYMTDWINAPDNNLDKDDSDPSTDYNLGVAYRQELRDFKVTDPNDYLKPITDLDWPVAPDFLAQNVAISRTLKSFSNY